MKQPIRKHSNADPARTEKVRTAVRGSETLSRQQQILQLQRAVGNGAVRRILDRNPGKTGPAPVQRFLEDFDGAYWMGGDGKDYWKENGDRLMAMWSARNIVPPSNVLEIIGQMIDKNITEYTLDDLTERVAKARETEDGNAPPATGQQEYTIPPLLHFYWAGRDIDEGKIENLNKWASKAKNTGWKIWVWHDGAVSKARDSGELNGEITVMRVTPAVIEDKFRPAYEAFVRFKNYPAASDLARYSILHKYGGVYADVDIGPGKMDFSQPLKIQSEIPLKLGPQLRDAQAVRDALKVVEQTEVTEEMVLQAAEVRRKEGAFGNHFIASPRKSELLKVLMDKMAAELMMMER